jgi:hypothetical protein
MYINFKTLVDIRLQPEDVVFLTAIKQKATDYLIETYWLESYNRLVARSLIESIKTLKKGAHPFTGLRLSSAGKKVLDALEEAEVEEEDKVVFEWLKKHYKKLGKEVGNGAKTQRHIRDFRIKSGIEKNNLLELCLAFLKDEDNMQYNNILEYAFYKAPTAFETRFNLEESRLYKYYLKRENYFKGIFKEY